jgi:hypothetical protein
MPLSVVPARPEFPFAWREALSLGADPSAVQFLVRVGNQPAAAFSVENGVVKNWVESGDYAGLHLLDRVRENLDYILTTSAGLS